MSVAKHGFSRTKLYKRYYLIKSRCYNPSTPNYRNYGGIGIKMCSSWKDDFLKFREWALANGYKDYLTIDRIDVHKGYSPKNCRWVCNKVQQYNKRNTFYITVDGNKHIAKKWLMDNGYKMSSYTKLHYYCASSGKYVFTKKQITTYLRTDNSVRGRKTSPYYGVGKTRSGKWRINVVVNGCNIIETYNDEYLAALAVDDILIKNGMTPVNKYRELNKRK